MLRIRRNTDIKYDVGITVMADMTPGEIKNLMTGFNRSFVPEDLQSDSKLEKPGPWLSAPLEFDGWRGSFLGRARNQLKGDCWAQATVAPVEAKLTKLKGLPKPLELSVQEIYDCSPVPPHASHTEGGLYHKGWVYLKRHHLGFEHDIPETNDPKRNKQKCPEYRQKANGMEGYTLTGSLGLDTADQIMNAIATEAPVAVSMDTESSLVRDKMDFMLHRYIGKVYTAPATCSDAQQDHAMVLVGYTQEAWIIRNSWGSHWGDFGHVQWDRRGPTCGLYRNAMVPKVKTK